MISHAGAGGSYGTVLLPGFLLFGFGITQVGVSNLIAAISEIRYEEAGSASGVVTAVFQIGGALDLAVITTLANSRAVGADGGRGTCRGQPAACAAPDQLAEAAAAA